MKRLFVLGALLLAGCGTFVNHGQPSVGGLFPSETKLASNNVAALQCNFKQEWELYNHGDKDAPPELGVAFSGGGMRAGTYSMGAMAALAEKGLLKDVDVFSAVSGGGYAASWYVLQKAEHPGVTDKELFDDSGAYQQYLAHNAKLTTVPRVAGAVLADTAFFPINLLVNGVFGWHANTTAHRRAYEYVLAKEFQRDPTNDGARLNYTFAELKTKSVAARLPLLVINTTAYVDDDSTHEAAFLKNSVYEFSPLRYGSEGYGYQTLEYPINVARAVAVSGAAADLSVLTAGAIQKTLLSALNLDLGFYVDNVNRVARRPDPGSCTFQAPDSHSLTKRKWTFRAIPLVYWAFPYWRKDAKGLRTYLSDGGHSENLGIFSLVRRLCRNIVVIDATGDKNFLFSDYKTVRDAVRRELGAELVIPVIEEVLKSDPDIGSKEERKKHADNRRKAIAEHPVMTGRVSFFPYPTDKDQRVLNLIYVKLSYDADHAEALYPQNVIAYRKRHPTSFPHQGLLDQDYSEHQYRAYRDLAYVTVMKNWPQ